MLNYNIVCKVNTVTVIVGFISRLGQWRYIVTYTIKFKYKFNLHTSTSQFNIVYSVTHLNLVDRLRCGTPASSSPASAVVSSSSPPQG